MVESAVLAEFGVVGASIGCLVSVCRWFLGALDKKDELIGTIVDKHDKQRERENDRHDTSVNKLSDAISELTKELSRKK